MNGQWKVVAARLDVEADRFLLAVRELHFADGNGRPTEEAWQIYVEAKRDFQMVIDAVIAFAPADDVARQAKLGVAARLTMLCHALDESWLEFEAERLAPAQRMLAAVFLDPQASA